MHYAFLCEFEELRSPLRDAHSQVSILTDTSQPLVSAKIVHIRR